MVAETFDVLSQAVEVERLDGVDNPAVERAAPLLEQASVCYLVSERMLEGVFEVWR